MAAEVITETINDLQTGSAGQKGYIIGKIVFEVASALIPATKVGKLMQVTKAEILQKLLSKTGLMRNGAKQVATATKAAVEVSQMCFVAGTPVKTQSGAMKIESVHAGTVVWSRDEFTQQEGWKRVLRTFVTHPTELYHLTYEVRGPPGSEGSADTLARSETLGVTAPHPFWVCNREKPGFVMAEDMQAGDELLTADGRKAVVTGKELEEAPSGETFTTYNFEVEGFHTYFAGENAVWVHNHGLKPCQLARAGMEALRKRNGDTWNALQGALAEFSYGDLSTRARLRLFNEARLKYLDGSWSGGTPTWNNISAQPRLKLVQNGQVDPIEYARQVAGEAGNSTKLGENLLASGIEAPWKGGGNTVAAHHIVLAGDNRFPSAQEARRILADAGIDINEAANGVFLPRTAEFDDLGKAVHNGSHPERYSEWVVQRLRQHEGNATELRKELQRIAVDLVETGWP